MHKYNTRYKRPLTDDTNMSDDKAINKLYHTSDILTPGTSTQHPVQPEPTSVQPAPTQQQSLSSTHTTARAELTSNVTTSDTPTSSADNTPAQQQTSDRRFHGLRLPHRAMSQVNATPTRAPNEASNDSASTLPSTMSNTTGQHRYGHIGAGVEYTHHGT